MSARQQVSKANPPPSSRPKPHTKPQTPSGPKSTVSRPKSNANPRNSNAAKSNVLIGSKSNVPIDSKPNTPNGSKSNGNSQRSKAPVQAVQPKSTANRRVSTSIAAEYEHESYPEQFAPSHQTVGHLEDRVWSAVKLNVKKRYPETSKEWLHNWPKTYHGTGELGMKGIIKEGFDLDHAERQLFGPGVYSTPNFGVAAGYGRQKIFTQPDGKKYITVLECRVNPETVRSVKAPGRLNFANYAISPKEEDVRPVKLLYHYIGEGDPVPPRFNKSFSGTTTSPAIALKPPQKESGWLQFIKGAVGSWMGGP